jgi:outer membrane protein assembly factor BamE (lipoprotein component of BamABCDE complex)
MKMKKLFFAMAAIAALTVISCNKSKTQPADVENDTTVVDSTTVDSTVVDSAVVAEVE